MAWMSVSAFQWVLGTALGILHSILVTFTYKRVPEPYMDEIFHVDQARRYCALDFSWNEKITTPPALYVLSLLGFCNHERYVNSALVPFFFVGAIRVRRLFTKESLLSSSLVVLVLPVLLHSSILFYTDLLSITVLLWAFSCKSVACAAALFAVGVFTRQTNIAWAAVYGAVKLIELFDVKRPLSSVLEAIIHLWSLILLALGFMAFFVLNGFRVVLGDHSAHQPFPHFMQLHYMLLFTCFSAAPCLLFTKALKQGLVECLKKPIRNLVFCILILCCIRLFTYEHPYLLADNRHFTFYIWRKWFRRHWLCKFILAPVYLLAACVLSQTTRHIQRHIVILFILATAIVLVPLPLLEPRYYIIPFVLWRLSVKQDNSLALFVEIAYSCFVNIAALYLFYEKPFVWANEPKALQRFMW